MSPGGAVLAPGVVVAVHGAELGSLLGQTLPKLPVNTPVNNPEPKLRVKRAFSMNQYHL